MSRLVTNFGDSTTTGNTVLQQNLTVQGAYSTFSGNILTTSASSTIGNAASRFASIYSTTLNVTTANLTSIYGPVGVVGIATTPTTGGANVQVQGNVYASNALTAPLIKATTSLNAVTTNTTAVYGTAGVVGVNTTPPSGGPTLYVQGNVYAANALHALNVLAVNSLNTSTANILTIVGKQGVVGIATSPVVDGATLQVGGNIWASNSIQTPNVSITTGNITTLNSVSIFGQPGLVGVNTSTPTASLHTAGNIFASNAIQTPCVYATTSLNAATTNTSTIYGPMGVVGVNQVPVTGGANLQVSGNLYASNAIVAPVITATTSINVSGVTNTTAIYGTAGLVGVNTASPTSTLHVEGNIYTANSFQAACVYATTSMNISALNTASIYSRTTDGRIGVNTSTNLGANLHIQGNLYASNAITSPTIFITTQANTAVLNVTSIYGTSGLVGLGTATPGASFHIQGNVYASIYRDWETIGRAHV